MSEYQRAKNTCIEMLTQRGYTIKSSDEKLMCAENDKEMLHVHLSKDCNLNITSIKDLVSYSMAQNVPHIILVYKEKITTQAKKSIEIMHDADIELFTYDELAINITKHRLVPLHEKVKDTETITKLKKLGLAQLPALLESDPVCKFYAFKKGSIIKVTRKDNIAYRVVK